MTGGEQFVLGGCFGIGIVNSVLLLILFVRIGR